MFWEEFLWLLLAIFILYVIMHCRLSICTESDGDDDDAYDDDNDDDGEEAEVADDFTG